MIKFIMNMIVTTRMRSIMVNLVMYEEYADFQQADEDNINKQTLDRPKSIGEVGIGYFMGRRLVRSLANAI